MRILQAVLRYPIERSSGLPKVEWSNAAALEVCPFPAPHFNLTQALLSVLLLKMTALFLD
jgi:hypothetical protein